jgi:hypothetical protein
LLKRLQRELDDELQQEAEAEPYNLLGPAAGRPGEGLRENSLPGRFREGGAGDEGRPVGGPSAGTDGRRWISGVAVGPVAAVRGDVGARPRKANPSSDASRAEINFHARTCHAYKINADVNS